MLVQQLTSSPGHPYYQGEYGQILGTAAIEAGDFI
jgi:hypothetical protein